MQEGEEGEVGTQVTKLVDERLLHLQNQLALGPDIRAFQHRRAGHLVGAVGEPGANAGTRLDQHRVAALDQRPGAGRGERDPPLSGLDLGGDADAHQRLPARLPARAPMNSPASARVSPRESTTSSSWARSQISGGAIWTTGSPRSPARAISPASSRRLGMNPRSRRSRSSASKRLASASLTSSAAQKK